MLRPLLKTLRPRQWAKQVFVPAALVADGKLFNPYYASRALAAVVVFCLVSSAVYIMNDLADVEKEPLPSQ